MIKIHSPPKDVSGVGHTTADPSADMYPFNTATAAPVSSASCIPSAHLGFM